MGYTLTPPEAEQSGGYTLTPPAAPAETREQEAGRIARNMLIPGGGYGADALFGIRQMMDAGAQMATRGLESVLPEGSAKDWMGKQRQNVEAINRDAKSEYEANFAPEARPGADLARGAGQAAAMALGGMATAPARVATAAPKAFTLLQSLFQGAKAGGGAAALTPIYEDTESFWGDKAQQAGTGAAVGAGAAGAGSILAKAIAPKLGASQQALSDKGVSLTPGQAAGGMLKSIEDRMAGFPIIGDLINRTRFRGITDFNRAIYAKATEPFGEEGAKLAAKADVGHAGIAKVGDFLSGQYEKALAKSVPSPVGKEFVAEVSNLGSLVPRAFRDDFLDTVKREIAAKVTPGGTLTPSVAKEIDSILKQKAGEYMRSGNPDQRALGSSYRELASEVRQLFAKNNPATAPLIKAADEGWATLVQMERAGAMLGARDGIFTPAQFLNAVKTGAQGVRRRQFSRGEALNQDFAESAKRVLPNDVPDSGTAGRLAAAVAAGNAPAVLGSLFSPAGLAMGAATLPYMPGIGPLLMRMMLNRPQGASALSDLARGAAPLLAAPVAATLQP